MAPERKEGRTFGSFLLSFLGPGLHSLHGRLKLSGSFSFKDFMKEVYCIWKASSKNFTLKFFSFKRLCLQPSL